MSSVKPVRVNKLIQEAIEARLTSAISGSSTAWIWPPAALEQKHHRKPVASPEPSKGVATELALEKAAQEIQQAVDAALAAIGAHRATPQEIVQQAIQDALKGLGITPGDSPASPARLPSLILNCPLSFDDPIPVGGNSNLSLFPDGTFSFSGHVHDAGMLGYDYHVTWGVASLKGTLFLFNQSGSIHGWLGTGSEDDDWATNDIKPALSAAWDDLSAGYRWVCRIGVNIDLQSVVDATKTAIGFVKDVVTLVG